MALLNQPIQVYGQLQKFFETLRSGTAPPSFTRQFLKDLNFKSSNHLNFIPLLKGLGFLTPNGSPTERYREFLDGTRWRQILATAVREAYGDLFVLKAQPTSSDLKMIAGKFKSTYNLSDIQADRNARTFLALLALSDPETLYKSEANTPLEDAQAGEEAPPIIPFKPLDSDTDGSRARERPFVGLHYNIQIHLPATKDLEVYNAIFKSLREHLID
jgi:hypothetical protein